MTTGDEPALSQPDPDNAPMISGRGTKIIADARGAYLAGNLDALIDIMDMPQQILFRQLIVQYALMYVESRVSIEDRQIAQALNPIRAWLKEPNNGYSPSSATESQREILQRLKYQRMRGLDSTVRYYVRQLAYLVLSSEIKSVAYTAAKLATHLESLSFVPHPVIWRWQIDAAWAILQGKEPPTFELPS